MPARPCLCGWRGLIGLFVGAAIVFFVVNVKVQRDGTSDAGTAMQVCFGSTDGSMLTIEHHDCCLFWAQADFAANLKPAPRLACLALICNVGASEEILIRARHLSKMQHYEFQRRYLIFDTKGRAASLPSQSAADALIQEKVIDAWRTVDYSQSYKASVNKTADWDMGIGTRQFHGHGVSFDDAQTDDFQLAYYFAVDQCEAAYIVVFELDQILYSDEDVSWVEDAIQVLRMNEGLILVSPSFPGVSTRKIRQRPTTRPIPKSYSDGLHGPATEDTTCQHPFTLPGRAALLDIQRYKQLPSRNQVKEHRCGGQLVRGKPCKSLPFVRSCGGMRTWEAALECVICNGEGWRQGHLRDWQRAWSQHAPLTSVRHDLAKLKSDIAAIEQGRPPAVMGPEYKGLAELERIVT
ncbi:unnamed protein product [Effrenium voratum]|nr:unnamed protein product [Effrenium voratum]CAJ1439013.1 unnamed protein product [Effrenium voratum]